MQNHYALSSPTSFYWFSLHNGNQVFTQATRCSAFILIFMSAGLFYQCGTTETPAFSVKDSVMIPGGEDSCSNLQLSLYKTCIIFPCSCTTNTHTHIYTHARTHVRKVCSFWAQLCECKNIRALQRPEKADFKDHKLSCQCDTRSGYRMLETLDSGDWELHWSYQAEAKVQNSPVGLVSYV